MFDMNEDYLSVSQVAEIKGVSRNAVYKAVKEGRLICVRIVGRIAITRAEAQKWNAKARTGRRQGTPTSEEAKAKIAASQRMRWKKRKRDSN